MSHRPGSQRAAPVDGVSRPPLTAEQMHAGNTGPGSRTRSRPCQLNLLEQQNNLRENQFQHQNHLQENQCQPQNYLHENQFQSQNENNPNRPHQAHPLPSHYQQHFPPPHCMAPPQQPSAPHSASSAPSPHRMAPPQHPQHGAPHSGSSALPQQRRRHPHAPKRYHRGVPGAELKSGLGGGDSQQGGVGCQQVEGESHLPERISHFGMTSSIEQGARSSQQGERASQHSERIDRLAEIANHPGEMIQRLGKRANHLGKMECQLDDAISQQAGEHHQLREEIRHKGLSNQSGDGVLQLRETSNQNVHHNHRRSDWRVYPSEAQSPEDFYSPAENQPRVLEPVRLYPTPSPSQQRRDQRHSDQEVIQQSQSEQAVRQHSQLKQAMSGQKLSEQTMLEPGQSEQNLKKQRQSEQNLKKQSQSEQTMWLQSQSEYALRFRGRAKYSKELQRHFQLIERDERQSEQQKAQDQSRHSEKHHSQSEFSIDGSRSESEFTKDMRQNPSHPPSDTFHWQRDGMWVSTSSVLLPGAQAAQWNPPPANQGSPLACRPHPPENSQHCTPFTCPEVLDLANHINAPPLHQGTPIQATQQAPPTYLTTPTHATAPFQATPFSMATPTLATPSNQTSLLSDASPTHSTALYLATSLGQDTANQDPPLRLVSVGSRLHRYDEQSGGESDEEAGRWERTSPIREEVKLVDTESDLIGLLDSAPSNQNPLMDPIPFSQVAVMEPLPPSYTAPRSVSSSESVGVEVARDAGDAVVEVRGGEVGIEAREGGGDVQVEVLRGGDVAGVDLMGGDAVGDTGVEVRGGEDVGVGVGVEVRNGDVGVEVVSGAGDVGLDALREGGHVGLDALREGGGSGVEVRDGEDVGVEVVSGVVGLDALRDGVDDFGKEVVRVGEDVRLDALRDRGDVEFDVLRDGGDVGKGLVRGGTDGVELMSEGNVGEGVVRDGKEDEVDVLDGGDAGIEDLRGGGGDGGVDVLDGGDAGMEALKGQGDVGVHVVVGELLGGDEAGMDVLRGGGGDVGVDVLRAELMGGDEAGVDVFRGAGGDVVSQAIRDIRVAIEEVKQRAVRSPYTPDPPSEPVWVMRPPSPETDKIPSYPCTSQSDPLYQCTAQSDNNILYHCQPTTQSENRLYHCPAQSENNLLHHCEPTSQSDNPLYHCNPQSENSLLHHCQPTSQSENLFYNCAPQSENNLLYHCQPTTQSDASSMHHSPSLQHVNARPLLQGLQREPPIPEAFAPPQMESSRPQQHCDTTDSSNVSYESYEEPPRSLSFPTFVDVPGPCDPMDLIDGVLFAAVYLGCTHMLSERNPSKSARMQQAQEAMRRVRPVDGNSSVKVEVDLFLSTQRIKVLNSETQDTMMDHTLRTISYIADIGNMLVLMARRKMIRSRTAPDQLDSAHHSNPARDSRRQCRMLCHMFQSEDAPLIAQAIGQAFTVAYQEFLRINGIDPQDLSQREYSELMHTQDMFNDDLTHFSKSENCRDVYIEKQKGEILGVVIVESGWGSLLPTVIIAALMHCGPAARCGRLNIGDQIMTINGTSLVGLPLNTCQSIIKGLKGQSRIKMNIVRCPPVTMVLIRRPDLRYQLGFSVQNGIICSLMRGGIAERGGVRVGHRIIEINGQSVVATPHERIVHILSNAVGEIHMKTMPAAMYRLLTAQEQPVYI
ncbi:hypothetical protein ACEWY4_016207 [Coilia grayii]|uniref:Uncharacterized protein n=1 Tax=Coilia grayii TaxID=363190 RepID=A0ABD1JJN8_9TELE